VSLTMGEGILPQVGEISPRDGLKNCLADALSILAVLQNKSVAAIWWNDFFSRV
jgi:hypothetical protein